MRLRIDYISVKIPILRLRKSSLRPATHISVGSVVVTENCLDVGLVAEEENGRPTKIYARYDGWRQNSGPSCYGSVDTIDWFDTGIRMSLREWLELSCKMDASQFYEYWVKVLKP